MTISGLPAEQPGSVLITSPDGFNEVVSSTRTIQLPPSSYLISAGGVGAGGMNYFSEPSAQSITVTDGASAAIEFSYKMVTAKINQTTDPRALSSLHWMVLPDAPAEQE